MLKTDNTHPLRAPDHTPNNPDETPVSITNVNTIQNAAARSFSDVVKGREPAIASIKRPAGTTPTVLKVKTPYNSPRRSGEGASSSRNWRQVHVAEPMQDHATTSVRRGEGSSAKFHSGALKAKKVSSGPIQHNSHSGFQDVSSINKELQRLKNSLAKADIHTKGAIFDKIDALFQTVKVPDKHTIATVLSAYSHEHGLCRFYAFESVMRERVTPDMCIYNILINVFGREKKWERVLSVVSEVRSKPIEVNGIFYSTLLRSYQQGEEPELFQETLREIEVRGDGFDSNLLTFLMEIYCPEANVAMVEKLYERAKAQEVKLTTRACHQVLKMYCLKNDFDKLTAFLKYMEDNELKLDSNICSMLFDRFAQVNRADVIEAVREKAERDNIPVYISYYNPLLEFYGNRRNFDKVAALRAEILEKGLRPNLITLQILLHAFGSAGKYSEVEQLRMEMWDSVDKKDYGELCEGTLAILARIYRESGEYEKLVALYEESNGLSFKKSVRYYTPFIKAFRAFKQDDRVKSILAEAEKECGSDEQWISAKARFCLSVSDKKGIDKLLKSRSTSSVAFGTLLTHHGKRGEIDEMQKFVHQMKNKRIPLDITHYNILIRAYGSVENLDEIRKLLALMAKDRIQPDSNTYGALIKAYGQAEDLVEMDKWLNQLRESGIELHEIHFINAITAYGIVEDREQIESLCIEWGNRPKTVYFYSALISAYGKVENFARIRELLKEMDVKGIDADMHLINILIDLYGKVEDFEEVEKAKQRMATLGFKPNAIYYNTLLKAYSRAQRHDSFEETVAMLGSCVDSTTYTYMFDYYGKRKDFDRVLALRDQLIQSGQDLDVYHYNVLIHVNGLIHNFQEVERLVIEMKDKGIKPNSATFTTRIQAAGRIGDFKRINEIRDEMESCGIQPDRIYYNMLMRVFSAHGRVNEAERFLEGGEASGMPLKVSACTGLIEFYAKSNSVGKVDELLKNMEDRGQKPTMAIYRALLKLYGDNGQYSKLKGVLKGMREKKINYSLAIYDILANVYYSHRQYSDQQKLSKIQKLYGLLVDSQIKPDMRLYTTLIDVFALLGDHHTTLKLINEIKERGRNSVYTLHYWMREVHSLLDVDQTQHAILMVKATKVRATVCVDSHGMDQLFFAPFPASHITGSTGGENEEFIEFTQALACLALVSYIDDKILSHDNRPIFQVHVDGSRVVSDAVAGYIQEYYSQYFNVGISTEDPNVIVVMQKHTVILAPEELAVREQISNREYTYIQEGAFTEDDHRVMTRIFDQALRVTEQEPSANTKRVLELASKWLAFAAMTSDPQRVGSECLALLNTRFRKTFFGSDRWVAPRRP